MFAASLGAQNIKKLDFNAITQALDNNFCFSLNFQLKKSKFRSLIANVKYFIKQGVSPKI